MESITRYLNHTPNDDPAVVNISIAILLQLVVAFVIYYNKIFNRRRSLSSRTLCIEFLMVFMIGLLTSNTPILFGNGEVNRMMMVASVGLFVIYELLTAFVMHGERWSFMRMDRTFHDIILTMFLIVASEFLVFSDNLVHYWMKTQAHDEMDYVITKRQQQCPND